MIALIDCNNFYASCERVFRPDLHGKAIVVLSNNDGCIISQSQEAKALQMNMGAPYFKIQQELKRMNVSVFSSNYTLYGDMSARVVECIDLFSDEVEVYSVDEAFALLSSNAKTDEQNAIQLRETILQWVGIPVKIGVAPSKTLAKIAAKQAKKSDTGVFCLQEADNIKEQLLQTELRSVWGIGRGFHKFLSLYEIKNAWEFSQLSNTFIRTHLGVVGLRMAYELRGLSCMSLKESKAKQQIMTSRSFSHPIYSLSQMKEAMASYVHENAVKLRREGLLANELSIFVNTYEHNYNEAQHHDSSTARLPFATDNTLVLTKEANQLMEKLFKPGYKYKRTGVLFSDLSPAENRQHELFATVDQQEDQKLNHVMDQLNIRYGNRSVHLASTGIERSWIMNSKFRSPRATTHWNELYKL